MQEKKKAPRGQSPENLKKSIEEGNALSRENCEVRSNRLGKRKKAGEKAYLPADKTLS